MTYPEALSTIHGLEGRPWREGLDRMRALVERAGLAQTLDGRGYIHVAGTNGKGTTTAFVESVLRHQGWRTGAFYSPFVVDYRERIQAQGRMIKPDELASLVEKLQPAADSMVTTEFGGITKFELEAALGLAYWEAKKCEWVALEVGLGGRLDATNVVKPKACIIVSIGLDHTSILGNTLEAIAREKAGIIKPDVPVIVGEIKGEALRTIERIAKERAAPLWCVGREVRIVASGERFQVQTPLGVFDNPLPSLGDERPPVNAALAVAACAAAGAIRDRGKVPDGLTEAWLPGRMDWREVNGQKVLFDGAHNAPAAEALIGKLGSGPIRLVANMIAGHEVEPFFRVFRHLALSVEVAPIDSPRALAVEEAVQRISTVGIPAYTHASVGEATSAALSYGDATVVVTGSNYLVGEALRSLD